MKLLNLFPNQKVTATGGGPDLDLSGYTRNVKFGFSAAKDAGTNPTLAAKLQASDGLARGLEYSTAGTTSNKINQAANANVYQAVKFTQSGARQIKRVAFRLKKFGTIASGKKLTLTLETDNAGAPSGTALGTANTVDIDTEVSTTEAWVVFTFAKPVDVADATVYHLKLAADYTASTSNYVGVVSTTAASGGTLESYDGTNWATTSTEKVMVYADQYNFSDVTGGAFTGRTTSTSDNVEEKNIDLRAIGSPVVRLYNTIGGTSNPAYYTQCVAAVLPIQST